MARVDVLKCIAKVADEYNYCKPTIVREDTDDHSNSFVEVHNLRHPIIERINESVKYVLHSLCLGARPPNLPNLPNLPEMASTSGYSLKVQDGMIIFGLNCSGKSSLMKSIGINLYNKFIFVI